MKLVFLFALLGITYCSSADETNKKININRLDRIRSHEQYLYILSSDDYILQIKHSDLKHIDDTLFVNKAEIREQVFHNFFGDDYSSKMETMNQVAKLGRVPENFKIKDFEVVGDTLVLLTQIDYPYQPDANNIRVQRLASITKMLGGQLLSNAVVDARQFTLEGEQPPYFIATSSFEYFNHNLYFNILKDSLTAANYFFVSTHTASESIKYNQAVELMLPYCFVQNNMGYLMSRSLLKDGIVSNVYTDTLYDLESKQLFSLGLTYNNNIRKEDAMSLRPKIDFTIFGCSKKDDVLTVIYQLHDDIWLGRYSYKNGQKLKELSKKKMTQTFGGISPFSTVMDEQGFYVFNPGNMQFQYTAY